MSAYEATVKRIAEGRCVLLDGGIGTELLGADGARTALEDEERVWGSRVLLEAPDAVLDVHRAYVEAGCDVITTNTWGLAAPFATAELGERDPAGAPVHWLDLARRGVAVARQAVEDADRGGECAVAFSLNGEIDSPQGREAIGLLARAFADGSAPDLILLETLSVLRPSLFETVASLVDTGLPVWLSFRRCRHGLCGVFGQHWGGPEGDAFGRAARRFEDLGVGALLLNCIPPDHVDGIVSYLRDFVDLPLGVYPNLGYLTNDGWSFDRETGGEEYARMARRWREEGAEIIGGCCGVRPAHLEAARAALAGTAAGNARRDPAPANGNGADLARRPVRAPWTDARGRRLYPLGFPELVVDPGVQPPDGASFLAWRHLHREGIGAHQRCLDVGSGAGLLAVQLALNGASHVHAIDVDRRAVANTLTNAFRNEVDGRVTAAAIDLYPWVPEERFDLIVASLAQHPGDPMEAAAGHRPGDYWGRSLVDQLIAKLDRALAPDGVAYVIQLSILSQQQTDALLAESGMEARVVDYVLFGFEAEHGARLEQIERVEELSDAHHLRFGGREVMVAYLLEIRART